METDPLPARAETSTQDVLPEHLKVGNVAATWSAVWHGSHPDFNMKTPSNGWSTTGCGSAGRTWIVTRLAENPHIGARPEVRPRHLERMSCCVHPAIEGRHLVHTAGEDPVSSFIVEAAFASAAQDGDMAKLQSGPREA